MKQILIWLILSALASLPFSASTQIIIDQSDMPVPGDTLRVSITADVPAGSTASGNDTVWDFSSFEPMSQRIDTFVNSNQTPPAYWLFFPPGVVSNLASPRGMASFFPGFPVEDFYTFYKNSSGAFTDAGFAFSFEGLPFPAKYDTPDIYYTFSLQSNSSWASESNVSLAIPGFFYYQSSRTRSNFVDGWGTVITPLGTYPSLRVRSDLIQYDTLFIDSVGLGYGITRNITEYKWLAESMGIPVMQINEEGQMRTAVYRDIPRLPYNQFIADIGPDTTVNKGATVTLTVSVTGGVPPYRYIWSTLDTTSSITLTLEKTELVGLVVIDGVNAFASDQRLITVVAPGIEETRTMPLNCYPNPAKNQVTVDIPPHFPGGQLILVDASGKTLRRIPVKKDSGTCTIDLTDFPSGINAIVLQANNARYMNTFIHQPF